MDAFQLKFIEEATELIVDLEKALLTLESSPNDRETISSVFRVMHTLKGNSAMFGFEKMGEFTHNLETIYDLVRQGKMVLTKEIFDVTLSSVDHLNTLLNDFQLSVPDNKKVHEKLLGKILGIINPEKQDNASESTQNSDDDSYGFFEEPSTFHIYLKPKPEIFNNGTNPLFLIDELYGFGQCCVVPYSNHIPDYSEFEPGKCYLYWDIFISTYKDINALIDVFIFVEDDCELNITKIASQNLLDNAEFIAKIEEFKTSGKQINKLDIQQIVENCTTVDVVEIKQKNVVEQSANTNSPVRDSKESTISSIRVSSVKIDEMMNLVSELVTTQARLSLLVETFQSPELVAIAENVQKLSRQLRDTAFSISLIPVQSIITRFQRLVRDLSNDLKKEVDFVAEGTETELDKTIIESLTDPIMHILRNSLDHGIEDAETRIKKGKPANGKILFRSYYSGVYVYIEIKDDGAGISSERVREKAIAKGLISHDAVLSNKEIFDLIFLPGFSTAAKVTDVSGRGVGMDVVKRKIAEIRGEVEVSSEVDKGTTITIKLPLTLSIIDGLLVKIHDTFFILQLTAVDKIYSIKHSEILASNRNLVVLDGESIPFYYLRDEFGMNFGEPEEIEQIIVVRYHENKVGLVIDKVIGEHQAVIKPLGKHYKKQEMVSGASILGDGTIALVTDTNKIIKQCSEKLN